MHGSTKGVLIKYFVLIVDGHMQKGLIVWELMVVLLSHGTHELTTALMHAGGCLWGWGAGNIYIYIHQIIVDMHAITYQVCNCIETQLKV